MSSPENESFLPPREDWPEVLLSQDGKEYLLRWDNTEIRKFKVGDGAYDHILHQLSEGEVMFLFLSEMDDPSIVTQLEESDFAITISPILDETTISLYSQYYTPAITDLLSQEP